jgi:hypothetical protein
VIVPRSALDLLDVDGRHPLVPLPEGVVALPHDPHLVVLRVERAPHQRAPTPRRRPRAGENLAGVVPGEVDPPLRRSESGRNSPPRGARNWTRISPRSSTTISPARRTGSRPPICGTWSRSGSPPFPDGRRRPSARNRHRLDLATRSRRARPTTLPGSSGVAGKFQWPATPSGSKTRLRGWSSETTRRANSPEPWVRIPPPALSRDRCSNTIEVRIMGKGNNSQSREKKKPKKDPKTMPAKPAPPPKRK